MSPGTRRLVLVLSLTLLAVLAMFAAWWLRPEGPDLERDLTPPPGAVQAPPLPPPATDDTDTDAPLREAADDDTGADGGAAFDLDTDDGVALLSGDLGQTEDGVPLRLPPGRAWLVAAIAPSEGRPVALALSDQAVLTEIRGNEGSYVQVLLPDLPERRVVGLSGVASEQLQAARARSPVFTDQGFVLLAELGGGPAILGVDLDAMLASPLDPAPPPAARLGHLRADGAALAVIADGSRVLVRDGGSWAVLEPGPAGLDGLALRRGPQVVTSRNGRISLKLPALTVGATLGQGREPVRLAGATAWMAGSEVVVQVDGADRPSVIGTALALPGADLAAAGSDVLWVRPDGALGRARVLGATVVIDAVLVPVQRITALGAVRVGASTRVAVAGRAGPVQRIEVWELPEGAE